MTNHIFYYFNITIILYNHFGQNDNINWLFYHILPKFSHWLKACALAGFSNMLYTYPVFNFFGWVGRGGLFILAFLKLLLEIILICFV